jgi:ParB family transcriptional regulator, chromosome partitioning protein
VAALEQEFRSVLGMRVSISHNTRGKGKLVVHFANHDEFDRLRMHVCGVIDEDERNDVG